MRTNVKLAAALSALLVLSGWVGVSSAAVQSVDLTLRGQTSLPSLGLDGTVKPRGQNGDVSVLGDFAFVAAGSKNHGALSTPGRICTDHGGVKVVDLSNPASPQVIRQITIADTKTVLTGPKGNPRRTANVPNVASTASSVDVLHNPAIGKDILAITTERCEQSFFDGARIEFWDVTDPKNIPATPIGVFDPENIVNPLCTPGPPITCPAGVSPPDGRWGIFEEVRMFTRNNGPGGTPKVYALATTPFSIGNTGGVSFFGDVRLLDITNPASPQQLSTFPDSAIGQNSNNGCRTFQAARTPALSPDRSKAVVSFYDGSQPGTSPALSEALHANFGSPNTAALMGIDLDNLPRYNGGSGTAQSPKVFAPNPLVFGYPPAADGGETPEGEVEGNAADVQTFTGPDGHLLAIVSEEDMDPALTTLTINAPGISATSRGCETIAAPSKLYLRAGQQLTGDVAYVGRGCPASPLVNSTLKAADPYLEDPNGKIALFESGGSGFDGCSFSRKLQRAFAAGATGGMYSIGGEALSLSNAGPDGGLPNMPSVGVKLSAFNTMVGFVPNRVFSGTALPAAWELAPGSVAANVTVKPFGVALNCTGGGVTPETCDAATNTSPITVRAIGHGLVTGDRVRVADVKGNTAANGNWTVTRIDNNVITLDGSVGNGSYTGDGFVVQCPPGSPNCAAPAVRTDISRFRSVANATDRVAGVRVKPANRFAVGAGRSYRAGAVLEVAERVDGAFEAVVDWFDAADALLGTSTIASRSAVTARAPLSNVVTAPAGATKAAMRFGWSGATAEGTAFADSLSFVPTGLSATLRDNAGKWGEQKIVDFSVDPPALVGTIQSPTSKVWPPPSNGMYMPRETSMFGNELAFTTWMTDGLRVVDVTAPSAPKEVAALLPPGVADPSPLAGAGPNNEIGGGPFLSRGASWPTQRLLTGVDVRRLGPDSARVVMTDINGGLFVVDATITRPTAAAPPAPPPPPPPAVVPPPPPPPAAQELFPAKLRLERARVRGRRLQLLVRLTGRSSGRVSFEYFSAGEKLRFTRPIKNGTISYTKLLSAKQGRLGTGIVTVSYKGNARTRPDKVRLRAARNPALLQRKTARIVNGRLQVSGKITPRARGGVVRVRMDYVRPDGSLRSLNYKAPISRGAWRMNEKLPAEAAKAGGHLSIQYTGVQLGRIGGQATSKEVQPQ